MGLFSHLVTDTSSLDSDLFSSSKGRSTAFDARQQAEQAQKEAAAGEQAKASSSASASSTSEADDDEVEQENVSSDEDDTLEQKYDSKRAAEASERKNGKRKLEEVEEAESEESESDAELVHETKLKKDGKKERKAKKSKLAVEEQPEQKDARTLFIGNVPADCATQKALSKALVAHMLSFTSEPVKSESIRFRSLAFASKVFGRRGDPESAEAPNHGRKRARDWRNTLDEDADEAAARGARSQPLSEGQKRKVAFIRGELNQGKGTCNAYLVLDAKDGNRETAERARDALVMAADASSFQGHVLRVDSVRAKSKAVASTKDGKPGTYEVKPEEARKTLFVGGLDFAEQEDALRKAIEDALRRERAGDDEQDAAKAVQRVRIIRDASTGLGKGFGYVLFDDANSVDEVLGLERPLKVSKRKVRLERCKSTVAAARSKARTNARAEAAVAQAEAASKRQKDRKPKRADKHAQAAPVDPELAEKLRGMSKDERKALKSTDETRLARRSDKKVQKRLRERFERKNKASGLGKATTSKKRQTGASKTKKSSSTKKAK